MVLLFNRLIVWNLFWKGLKQDAVGSNRLQAELAIFTD